MVEQLAVHADGGHHLRVQRLLEFLAQGLAQNEEAAHLDAAAGAACAGTNEHEHHQNFFGESGPQVKITAGKTGSGDDGTHLKGCLTHRFAKAVIKAVDIGRDNANCHQNNGEVAAHFLADGAVEFAQQQQEVGIEVDAEQDHENGHDPLDVGRKAGKAVILEAEAAGARRAESRKHGIEDRHPANQQDEIRRFAESKQLIVNHWVTEVASGKKSERDRKLGVLLRRLKRDDTLIVTEISRLSRTLTDIMAIMGKCLERGINLYTTKEGYSFDNTINSKVLCFAFGLVAEIERNLISMRTREALALRRAEGMVLGRRHGSYTKMNVLIKNRQVVITMLNKGKSISDICKHFDLSRDTFAKFRMKYPSVQKALDKKEQLRISRFKNKQINA